MSLRQELTLQSEYVVNPILGLSLLELEVLLDESFDKIQEFSGICPNRLPTKPSKGNYFFSKSFFDSAINIRGKIDRKKHLENPQVFIEGYGSEFLVRYNDELVRRLEEKLSKFKREKKVPSSNIFSIKFLSELNWIRKNQLRVVCYLCEVQSNYLRSKNPFDLNKISKIDISYYMGYSQSMISRLTNNLTIKIPNGEPIFVNEIIPGNKLLRIQGVYIMRQLSQDPKYFENGRWKISDEKLVLLIRGEYGLNVARRTVCKYKNLVEDEIIEK